MRELRHIYLCLRYPVLWVLMGLVLLFSALAAQVPFNYTLDAASPRADPFLLNFHGTQQIEGRDARWSDAYAYIKFPGTGGNRPLRVTVTFNPYRVDAPGAEPVLVQGLIGGEGLYTQTLPVESGWQAMVMDVDASHPLSFAARDLVIEIRSDIYRSPEHPGEDLGVAVSKVEVEPLPGASSGLVIPNVRTVGLTASLILALYLLLVRAGGLAFPRARRRLSLLVSAVAALVLCWAMFLHIADVAVALPHLVTALVGSYILFIISAHLLPRLFKVTSPSHLAYVSVALTLAFLLRFGISDLPQTNVVDLPYHLKWLRILLGGGFTELYLPGALSSVPPEWGLDVLIPKSPLFYVALWPLGLFRGIDLSYAMVLIVSLLDALVVLGVYALVRRVSPSGAVWSSLLYAAMPLSFRAFIYGILPTIFAQAITLAVLMVAVLWPKRLAHPIALAVWTLGLAASLLAFPTALAFNSFMVISLGVGWVRRKAASRRVLGAMLVGLATAIIVSFVAYYGLYVEPFMAHTLPALQSGINVGGKELWPNGLPDLLAWTAGYAIAWVLWMLIPLAVLLLWHSCRESGQRLSILMLAWLAIFLGGMALNFRIDMIGKHIYYTVPAAAIASGLIFSHLWKRAPGGPAARVLVVLMCLHLVWAGLSFAAGRL
jgi:hypothetical protein